ncbi:MAG: DUF3181 family protein [Cyanobacteria bacterium P01_F01_bin.42]
MGKSFTSQDIEELAADIGRDVYIDVAKWHLFLADAHLHTSIAEKVAVLIEDDDVSDESVQTILQRIAIPLGGGKKELPLIDLLPVQSLVSLMDIIEEHQ